MIADYAVPALLLPLAEGYTSGEAADGYTAAVDDPFDGSELLDALQVAALPDPEYSPIGAGRTVAPGNGNRLRGLMLTAASGQVGISLGYGKVIEPAGRLYVVTDWTMERWPEAWALPYVLYTGRVET